MQHTNTIALLKALEVKLTRPQKKKRKEMIRDSGKNQEQKATYEGEKIRQTCKPFDAYLHSSSKYSVSEQRDFKPCRY